MTALFYMLEPHVVVVAMDAQASTGDGECRPHSYVTKILPLPQLNGLMCGTGTLEVLLNWFCFVQTGVVAKDMGFISEIAPRELARIQAQYPGGTATIYHFGFDSEERGRGFAFRSNKGFAREELQVGTFGLKPGLQGDDPLECFNQAMASVAAANDEGGVTLDLARAAVAIMQRLKAEDELKPSHERLGIGGEIHVALLKPREFLIRVHDAFADKADRFNEMLARTQGASSEASDRDSLAVGLGGLQP